MAHIHIFDSEAGYWNFFRSQLAGQKDQSIAASGGSAAKLFDHFSKEEMKQWSPWIIDERYVPVDHDDSNYKLLNNKFDQNVCAWNTVLEWKDCAEGYAQKIQKMYDEHGYVFDTVILGVGPDGHTMSLFPHSEALESDEWTTTASTDVFAVQQRLSCTWKVLENSKRVFVLMIGSGKKEIFDIITNEKTDWKEFPARRLLDMNNVEICFLNA